MKQIKFVFNPKDYSSVISKMYSLSSGGSFSISKGTILNISTEKKNEKLIEEALNNIAWRI